MICQLLIKNLPPSPIFIYQPHKNAPLDSKPKGAFSRVTTLNMHGDHPTMPYQLNLSLGG